MWDTGFFWVTIVLGEPQLAKNKSKSQVLHQANVIKTRADTSLECTLVEYITNMQREWETPFC